MSDKERGEKKKSIFITRQLSEINNISGWLQMDSLSVNYRSYIRFTVLCWTLGSAHCFSLLKLVWKPCLHMIIFFCLS